MSENFSKIKNKRPLSPHLTIYKPQISSVLSIGHRLSGIGLFFVLAILTWWFICWANSGFDADHFTFFENIFVKIIMFLGILGYSYHFCTGIRHLVWDAGYGFSIRSVDITGYLTIICTILLTCFFWYII